MSNVSYALIPALWLAWLIYWGVAARGAKETARHESAASRLSHYGPIVLGGLFYGVPGIAGATLEQPFLPPAAGWDALSIALVAAGLGFAVAARVWLAGNWSATVTLKHGHELVETGPYGLVRHPIYTGLLTALAGTALMVDKWRALIGLALMTAALVRKMAVEERFMREAFGEAYARYRAEVKALVPFVI